MIRLRNFLLLTQNIDLEYVCPLNLTQCTLSQVFKFPCNHRPHTTHLKLERLQRCHQRCHQRGAADDKILQRRRMCGAVFASARHKTSRCSRLNMNAEKSTPSVSHIRRACGPKVQRHRTGNIGQYIRNIRHAKAANRDPYRSLSRRAGVVRTEKHRVQCACCT